MGASLLAKIAVMLGAGLGSGLGAADAAAASLSIKVAPANLHPGVRYTVTITGSYAKRARPPYLLAFIQYGGQSCKSTATAEYALPTTRWSWDFYPQRAETRSPFKSVAYWKAGSRLGSRWVCAYLYANQVTPTTTARPLVWASASFRNTRR
jgi:hypothetical protein